MKAVKLIMTRRTQNEEEHPALSILQLVGLACWGVCPSGFQAPKVRWSCFSVSGTLALNLLSCSYVFQALVFFFFKEKVPTLVFRRRM